MPKMRQTENPDFLRERCGGNVAVLFLAATVPLIIDKQTTRNVSFKYREKTITYRPSNVNSAADAQGSHLPNELGETQHHK